jgi:hypothetical protein
VCWILEFVSSGVQLFLWSVLRLMGLAVLADCTMVGQLKGLILGPIDGTFHHIQKCASQAEKLGGGASIEPLFIEQLNIQCIV